MLNIFRRSMLLGLLAVSPFISAQELADLPTIRVIGEMLSYTLQNSGNSVLVIEEEALDERKNLKTVRDVLMEVPNFTVITGTGKAPTVRGVDGTGPAENANAFFAGSRPRLNWQIDGRSATYNEVVFGDIGIWDLERIEVFRGAQSSLVGKNAIAGTVLVETEDPKAQQEFAARLEGGNLDQKRLSFMVNQPLSETFFVRFAADGFERDSPVDYDSYSGVDDPAQISGHSLRGKLLYEPNSERNTRLLVTLSDVEYEAPNSEIVVRPFEDQRSNFPEQPVHNPHTTSLGVEFISQLNESLAFELDVSATAFEFKRKTAPEGSQAEVDTDEQELESRIRYISKGGSEWVAGVWLHRSRQDEWIQFFGEQTFEDQSDSRAVYAEGLIPLTDTLEVTLGLRYEEEDREREGGDPTGELVNIAADETYDALLPKFGINYQPNEQHSMGILYSRGYNAGGGGITFAFPIVNYEYDEEFVDNVEIYGRQEWFEGRLRTTQNLFYALYDDMQLPFDLTPENTRDEAYVVRNAGEVQTKGLELGADWLLNERWKVFASLAFLDAEITDYPNSGLEGNSLFMAPRWSGQLGGTWRSDRWTVQFNTHFSDGYYTTVSNDEGGEVDSYATLNGSISCALMDQVELYVSVNNIFDEDQPIALYPGINPGTGLADSDFDTAVLMQPMLVTAGVMFSF